MTYIDALLLAIVEGITEFLPISSTGHLILVTNLLAISQTDFVKSFEIFIQLGAICAVVFLYWKTLLNSPKILKQILIAFLPTALLGFTLYKLIKEFLLGNAVITIAALLIGGILLIILELLYKEKEHHYGSLEHIPLKTAFLMGACQSIAMIPGVSRSAATIIGALLLGTKRKAAVEFSFVLAIPTMLAASSLDILKGSYFLYSSEQTIMLLIGFLGSFGVAIIAIKFLLQYIQHHSFILFGIYRIVLSLFFILFIL